MRVPGSNLLKMAMGPIAKQSVIHHAFSHRTQNDVMEWVAHYKPAKQIKGSLQPMSRSLAQQNGLDLNAQYITFYTSKKVMDVQRDISGDQIVYDGDRYQCLYANDWLGVDGWTGVVCVRLTKDQCRGKGYGQC